MSRHHFALCFLMIAALALGGCGSETQSEGNSPTRAPEPSVDVTPSPVPEPSATPEPTNTPKPKVRCPDDEVGAFLDELDLTLEEWDDISVRAGTTARMSLSPVIGELQDAKRNTKRLDVPECGEYLLELVTMAMERDIDSYLSFLAQDSDTIVARKMDGAEKAWAVVLGELSAFQEDAMLAYETSAVSAAILGEKLDEAPAFEMPEGWTNSVLKGSSLAYALPEGWRVSTAAHDKTVLKAEGDSLTVTILPSISEKGSLIAALGSDAARLMFVQLEMENAGWPNYHEKDADAGVYAKNRAYVVRFSTRSRGADVDNDVRWAVIMLPDESLAVVYAEMEDEIGQFDLLVLDLLYGSLYRREGD